MGRADHFAARWVLALVSALGMALVGGLFAAEVLAPSTVAAGTGGVGAPVQPHAAMADEGCLSCHVGIEEMHPGFPLSCTDCHGGDPDAKAKGLAHVLPSAVRPANERVAPLNRDLAHARFVNPMDLRVAKKVCGDCHGKLVDHLMVSLHGTTTGHLSDGFFEVGLEEERDSRYGGLRDQGAPWRRGPYD